MNGTSSNTRNQSIDLIKTISMCLVVCLHTTHTFINSSSGNLAFCLYNTAIIAIPMFFMVSGYLLIGRKNSSYRYSAEKIFGILRFVFLITGFTWLVHYSLSWWTFDDLLLNFFGSFFQEGYYPVFWYFGAMIIVYLLYPLINKLHQIKELYLLTFIILAIIQNCAFVSNLIGLGESDIPITLRFWNWIFYFMLGGFMKNYSVDRNLILITTGILIISTLFTRKWLDPYIHNYDISLFYSSPIVIAYACSAFLLLLTFRIKDSLFIKECSILFLPVYAIHPVIVTYTYKLRQWLWYFDFGCLVYWLAILLLSCLVSFFIMKVPYLKLIFKL